MQIKLNSAPEMCIQGVQCMELGAPYFRSRKNVLVVLMPYTAELFEYDLTDSPQVEGCSNLVVRGVSMRLPLPQATPTKLCKA